MEKYDRQAVSVSSPQSRVGCGGGWGRMDGAGSPDSEAGLLLPYLALRLDWLRTRGGLMLPEGSVVRVMPISTCKIHIHDLECRTALSLTSRWLPTLAGLCIIDTYCH